MKFYRQYKYLLVLIGIFFVGVAFVDKLFLAPVVKKMNINIEGVHFRRQQPKSRALGGRVVTREVHNMITTTSDVYKYV